VSAADTYAARVDAVLAQRTRLRGPQPPGDSSPACRLTTQCSRAIRGGSLSRPRDHGRVPPPDESSSTSWRGRSAQPAPGATLCEVINVDPSTAMLGGFEANARQASISMFGSCRLIGLTSSHARLVRSRQPCDLPDA